MEKSKNITEFYVLCNKLKNVVRTGWVQWGVSKERIESVAEHIFGTQMLAIAMFCEFEYDLDIKKVLCMLAVHETEEILIGDLTLFEISKEEKKKIGKNAVQKIFGTLSNAKYFEDLLQEFEEAQTPEAKFAYWCDKLECDLQCKLYDEENLVDLTQQKNNKDFQNPAVQKVLQSEKTWSGAWLSFGQERYGYDKNFLEVSNYAKTHNIAILPNKKNM